MAEQREKAASDARRPSSSDRKTDGNPAIATRRRRWAPRTRTGCTTCRAHHRKCDEGKPSCRHCITTRRPCRYPLEWQPPRGAEPGPGSGPVTEAEAETETTCTLSRAPLCQSEPPEWEYVEGARYYFCMMLPLLTQSRVADTPKKALLSPEQYDLSKMASRNNFLMTAICHRITTLCSHNRVPVRQGAWPGINHLWSKFYGRMAEAVAELNRLIQADRPPANTLRALASLLGAEMVVMESPWRAHLQGFLALIETHGGVAAIMESGSAPVRTLQFGSVIGILSNTTSPAGCQLLGFHKFKDKQVLQVYTAGFFNLLPCPSCLFLEIHRITRLRVAVTTASPAMIHGLVPIATGIAKRIAGFSPGAWKESYDIPAEPTASLLARIFKTATTMYGLLSLPPVLGHLFGPSHRMSRKQRCDLRNLLLEDMEEAHKSYPRLDSLSWVIAVLGVALHDGTANDRARLFKILDAIQQMPGVYSGPATLFDLLEAFWASGKSAWDDCFYKPSHTIA
ncbi:hypothetical protein V2A60_001655 [Cordyceps javanica]|uniref:C6 finger domain-containing protein n=1 Tax=Cordyceps javanica TaxID=43265 RepID=A0A545VFS3_9HYPO|nr:C6 finger domain-containing protein [Cordyceps javanica]TQW11765.1 C6 finger domain protein [Cordyceps javanica]